MNREALRTRAEEIYQAQQAVRPQWERMGGQLPSIMTATVEEIETHLVFCAETAEAHDVNLNAEALWGKSHEDIIAEAERKAAKFRRSAGYRALKSKYGEDAAKRIINKHSGGRR